MLQGLLANSVRVGAHHLSLKDVEVFGLADVHCPRNFAENHALTALSNFCNFDVKMLVQVKSVQTKRPKNKTTWHRNAYGLRMHTPCSFLALVWCYTCRFDCRFLEAQKQLNPSRVCAARIASLGEIDGCKPKDLRTLGHPGCIWRIKLINAKASASNMLRWSITKRSTIFSQPVWYTRQCIWATIQYFLFGPRSSQFAERIIVYQSLKYISEVFSFFGGCIWNTLCILVILFFWVLLQFVYKTIQIHSNSYYSALGTKWIQGHIKDCVDNRHG